MVCGITGGLDDLHGRLKKVIDSHPAVEADTGDSSDDDEEELHLTDDDEGLAEEDEELIIETGRL